MNTYSVMNNQTLSNPILSKCLKNCYTLFVTFLFCQNLYVMMHTDVEIVHIHGTPSDVLIHSYIVQSLNQVENVYPPI
jgi:hypothetical protein